MLQIVIIVDEDPRIIFLVYTLQSVPYQYQLTTLIWFLQNLKQTSHLTFRSNADTCLVPTRLGTKHRVDTLTLLV